MILATRSTDRSSAPATLAHALLIQAERRGTDLAFRFLDTVRDAGKTEDGVAVSYVALHGRACAVANALRRITRPGDRALLLYEPGRDYIASFFGCLYAGVIAVPIYPPTSPASRERLDKIVIDATPAAFLTSQALLAACKDAGLEVPRADAPAPVGIATDDAWSDLHQSFVPDVSPSDTAFLQYTSGSTGDPRGVVLSHANLLANVTEYSERLGLRSDDRRVSWLPPYHDMGLIGGILVPIVSGTEVILMSPFSFLKDPISWLDLISQYHGTYSTAPNFGYELCVKKITPERFERLDLRHWRVAGIGAEPPRRATMERFAQRFAAAGFTSSSYLPAYGLAEATLVATTQIPGIEPRTRIAPETIGAAPADPELARSAFGGSSEVVSNGIPLPETVVKIVDPDTHRPCADGAIGEIWLRSPSVASGYWNREAESQKAFGGMIEGDPQRLPYLRTGDLGFLADGELYCSGRMKDLLIIRGRNYYPQDIEETVSRADPQLRPGCCAAFSVELDDDEERLVVVQEHMLDELPADALHELVRKLRSEVGRSHGVPLHEVVLIRRNRSLKTSSGKIRRRATKAAYLDGSLPIVARDRLAVTPSGGASTDEWYALESLDDKLRFALASALGRKTVADDDDFFAFGGDSLRAIEVVTIASEQGIEIVPELLYRAPTLRQLAAELAGDPGAGAAAAASTGQKLNVVLRSAIPRVGEAETYALSPVQRRWALDYLADRQKTWVNISFRVALTGRVVEADVRRAIDSIWAAHESLRTVFPGPHGAMRQKILPSVSIPLSTWPVANMPRIAELEAKTVFDLETGPLARAALFVEPTEGGELLVTVHHMVADGWSLVIARQQLAAACEAARDGGRIPPPTAPSIRYRDYAEWMLEIERADGLAASREHWRGELEAPLPVTLAVDDAVARGPLAQGASVLAPLSRTVVDAVKALAHRRRVSDAAVLMAAFFQAVHHRTGARDLIIGTPLAGRDRSDIRTMVGMFINLVPIRVRGPGDWRFADTIQATHGKVLRAVAHQRFQLDSMVDDFGLTREPHCFPITNTFFTRVDMGKAVQPALAAGVTERVLPIDVRFHAMLYVNEYTDGSQVELRYRRALFEPAAIRGILDDYVAILERETESR